MRTFLILVALTAAAAFGRFPFALCIGAIVSVLVGLRPAGYVPSDRPAPELQAELDYRRERMKGRR